MFELIRNQLSRSVPFAGYLGISVASVDAQAATARVAEAPHLNNHVGTFHAGAIFTLCESAAGAALAGALLPVIMQTRFVVRDARVNYLKPAKGTLLAQAALVDEAATVLDELKRLGRADVVVDVSARTHDGQVVAKASFNWSLKQLPA